MLQAKI